MKLQHKYVAVSAYRANWPVWLLVTLNFDAVAQRTQALSNTKRFVFDAAMRMLRGPCSSRAMVFAVVGNAASDHYDDVKLSLTVFDRLVLPEAGSFSVAG